jgi:hypothetical protein
VVKEVKRKADGSLDPSGTTFKTKNGNTPFVEGMSLEELLDFYDETTSVKYYRAK